VEAIEARLAADVSTRSKAVMVVHNETSTGCVTHPLEVARPMDRTKHSALLMVDTISGLGSMNMSTTPEASTYRRRFAEGLMLPPARLQRGVGKALAVAKAPVDAVVLGLAGSHRPSTNWAPSLHACINLLYGLREAIAMLERGLDNASRGHKRHSAATRARRRRFGDWKPSARPAKRIRRR